MEAGVYFLYFPSGLEISVSMDTWIAPDLETSGSTDPWLETH